MSTRAQQMLTALILTCFVSSSTMAEIGIAQWREMNNDLQAAYLQGLIGAVTALGVSDHLREPMSVGMHCLAQQRWTAAQISQRFDHFLAGRTDLKDQPVPMAFLEYLIEACDR
jgi:hypothetical protein